MPLRKLNDPEKGEVELDMIREDRAMSGAVHLVSARAT
jgi:hypothetical protein